MRELVPALTKGNGSPVGGMEPLTTAMLIAVCMAIMAAIPAER